MKPPKFPSGRVPDVAYFKDTLPNKNNKSGIKGVSWNNLYKKWSATLTAFGEKVILGYYDKIEDAENALNIARAEFNTKEDVINFKSQKNKISGRNVNVAYFKNDIPNKNNKTGVKGVYWHKSSKKYIAVLCVRGKTITVGSYTNVPEAEKALNEARIRYQ